MLRPDPITAEGVPARNGRERALGDHKDVGQRIYDLAAELYPICRSITGNGVRTSLGILGRHIDIETTEVPTGTQVFDWTIPREWNIADAYIANARGERVVDFRASQPARPELFDARQRRAAAG